jgi:hypothetical protein
MKGAASFTQSTSSGSSATAAAGAAGTAGNLLKSWTVQAVAARK